MSGSKNPSTKKGVLPWLRSPVPFTFGALLALVLGGASNFISSTPRLEIFAVLLASIGGVYVGSGLSEERNRGMALEATAAIFCTVLSLVGLWVSPVAIVAGYVLHGFWDLLHHPISLGATISKRWYPPFCVGFDWMLAAIICYQYLVKHI